VYDEELEVAHVPLADDVARVLDAHPEARAGLVFHAELRRHERRRRGNADACHARELPLVTDDAWGLSTTRSAASRARASALSQGADVTIGSMHKTMRSRPGPSTSNPSSSASPTYRASIDGPIAAIARELLDGSASSTAASRDFNARSHRSSPR
jgi:hypothetical protein